MVFMSKRDHLIDTALFLFNRDGFHATGIDRILAEAGVAKMTLYNHFASKDDLILAALRLRDERFRSWLKRHVSASGLSDDMRPLALFDAMHAWFAGPDFYGCMFINASGEYSDANHPVHRIAREHKLLVREYVGELVERTGAADMNELTDALMLLMEGAIVSAQVTGDAGYALQARKTAERLMGGAG